MGAGAHGRAPGTLARCTLHACKTPNSNTRATARGGGDRTLLLQQAGGCKSLLDEVRAKRGAELCAWGMLDLGVGWGLCCG